MIVIKKNNINLFSSVPVRKIAITGGDLDGVELYCYIKDFRKPSERGEFLLKKMSGNYDEFIFPSQYGYPKLGDLNVTGGDTGLTLSVVEDAESNDKYFEGFYRGEV